jgi:hypothetical protein
MFSGSGAESTGGTPASSEVMPIEELSVFQYSENFGRFNLTLNDGNALSPNKYYFTFSYFGEDYQAYRSLTLHIDGKEYYLLFTSIEQDWNGFASEICRTNNLDNEIITALKTARQIECNVDSVRFNDYITFQLSSDALEAIKQYLK